MNRHNRGAYAAASEGAWMIRQLHDEWGLSYSAIARSCGRDRQSVSRIARGKGAYTGRYKLDRLRRLYEAVTGDVTEDGAPSTPLGYLDPYGPPAYVPAAPAAPSVAAATWVPSSTRAAPTRGGRASGETWVDQLSAALGPAAALLRERHAAEAPRSTHAPASSSSPQRPSAPRPPSEAPRPVPAPAPARARPVAAGAELPRMGVALGPYEKCGRCGAILRREQLRAYVATNGARGLFCGQPCADAWAADIAASMRQQGR